MKKNYFLLLILVIITVSFIFGIPQKRQEVKTGKLVIFHAGSLNIPFARLAEEFSREYPYIEVLRESAGSRTTVRKVIELNREADLIATADYMVIKNLMFPNYARWYLKFATNEMVLMYTGHSRYSEEIDRDNWFEILLKPDVQYGHSDPDSDPAGYRTHLLWKLAEKYYDIEGLYQRLNEGCPPGNIRPKSSDLIALLEAGELDYAFGYKSVAKQHSLPFIQLPAEINLGDEEKESFYGTVSFEVSGKEPGKKIVHTGKPVVYGITIPDNAPHRKETILFLKFLLGPRGRSILEENGQPPIIPATTDHPENLPGEIKTLLKGE